MITDIIIDNENIDFAPSTEYEEILQNVKTICTTIKGTVPLDREFGIDGGIVDIPANIAKAQISAKIIEAVRLYEPRANVVKVTFRESDSQEVLPVVSIRIL